MRRVTTVVASAIIVVIMAPGMALANATYPPPTHHVTITPGPPTAFTGADIATPLKIMVALVLVALCCLVATVAFLKPKEDEG